MQWRRERMLLTSRPFSAMLPRVMEQLEIELKFFIADLDPLRERIRSLGAACTTERGFEHNVRYETDDDALRRGNCLLRLRRDRTATLTFKSPPPASDPRFKTYRELEVTVEDFDTMDAILNALGFTARQVYQKWRETWQLGDACLCLDSMPFGNFLEIEGPPASIMQSVRLLGLRWEHRILASYLGMFATLREAAKIDFADLTFDNFAGIAIEFEHYRHRFEAEPDGAD